MSAHRPHKPADSNRPVPTVTILVADADADMRLYVRRCLRSVSGVIKLILEAADGEEALARVERGDVDLLITDVVLPRMDGFALCRAVQRDARLAHVSILFVTGEFSAREFKDHARDIGAAEMIARPFNADQLAAKVTQILAGAQARQQIRSEGRDT